MAEKISKLIGNQGEAAAAKFLKNCGFNLILTNFYSRYGEIDIICENDKYIVFIEVKTRKNNSMVSGAESVSKHKQGKILKTAAVFLANYKSKKQPRFDVLEILASKDRILKFNHIKNAFGGENFGNAKNLYF